MINVPCNGAKDMKFRYKSQGKSKRMNLLMHLIDCPDSTKSGFRYIQSSPAGRIPSCFYGSGTLKLTFPETFHLFEGSPFGLGNDLPDKPGREETHYGVDPVGEAMVELRGKPG